MMKVEKSSMIFKWPKHEAEYNNTNVAQEQQLMVSFLTQPILFCVTIDFIT